MKLKGRASSNIKANSRAAANSKKATMKVVEKRTTRRAAASTFAVKFLDGTVISFPVARDVFLSAIKKFGVGRVATLGFKSFIEKDIKLLGGGEKGAAKIGQWFVSTHSSTDSKIRRIKSIARKLGERVEIDKV